MRKGICTHFNGPIHNKICDAGVNYRARVGGPDLGWLTRTPCMAKHNVQTCDKYQEPTDDEIRACEDNFRKSFEGTQMAIALIIEKTGATPNFESFPDAGGKGSAGEIECPVCAGVLRYAVSGVNNHIHGHCSTPGCLSWMM